MTSIELPWVLSSEWMYGRLVRSESSWGAPKVVTGVWSEGLFGGGLCHQPVKSGLTPGHWSDVTAPSRPSLLLGFMITVNEDPPICPSANRIKVFTDDSSSSIVLHTNDQPLHPSDSVSVHFSPIPAQSTKPYMTWPFPQASWWGGVLVRPLISFKLKT